MKLLSLLFSFKGRLARPPYWLGIAIGSFMLLPPLLLVAYDCFLWLTQQLQQNNITDPITAARIMFDYPFLESPHLIIGIPFITISFWSLMAVTAKRLHDLNLPGWPCLIWLPLNFIPAAINILLSIILPIILGAIKGTEGPNKYGVDPIALAH